MRGSFGGGLITSAACLAFSDSTMIFCMMSLADWKSMIRLRLWMFSGAGSGCLKRHGSGLSGARTYIHMSDL